MPPLSTQLLTLSFSIPLSLSLSSSHRPPCGGVVPCTRPQPETGGPEGDAECWGRVGSGSGRLPPQWRSYSPQGLPGRAARTSAHTQALSCSPEDWRWLLTLIHTLLLLRLLGFIDWFFFMCCDQTWPTLMRRGTRQVLLTRIVRLKHFSCFSCCCQQPTAVFWSCCWTCCITPPAISTLIRCPPSIWPPCLLHTSSGPKMWGPWMHLSALQLWLVLSLVFLFV